MDRKQAHELVQALSHPAIERRELLKVFSNLASLLIGLGQQPFRDDVGHVLPDNAHLLVTILYSAQALGYELKFRIIEQALLQARNDAKAERLAGFTDLPQKAQVQNEVVLFA